MHCPLKINIKIVAFIIIFISIIEPDYFSSISIIHNYYLIMRVITLFIAILYFILRKIFPTYTFLITVYFIIYGFSTYMNNGEMIEIIAYASSVINITIWLELTLKYHTYQGLYSLNFVYSLYVYINFIFNFLIPDGYTQSISSTGNIVSRYFLGVENQFAATLIPAIIINLIYNYMKYNRLRLNSYILIGVVTFTFFYIWSATSILGIMLILIYLVFINRKIINKIINKYTIIITAITIYVMIVILRSVEYFAFIIEGLLNKDLTLSTRTLLWDRAFSYIADSPIIGYGYLSSGRYLQVTITRFMDSHNTVLQLLLQHGLLGMFIIVILIILFFKKTSLYKNNKIIKLILYSLFVSTTMMLTEVYSFSFILIILTLGIFSPYIISEQNKLLNKEKI